MSVPTRFVANLHRSTQIGKDTFEVLSHHLDAAGFGAEAQEVLFEIQVQRQGAGELIGKQRTLVFRDVLLGTCQRQDLAMQFQCAGTLFGGGLLGFVFDEKDLTAKERALLIHLKKLESLAALSDNVHASVVIGFGDRQDFSAATYVGQGIFAGTNDPEGQFLGQAFADHFLVTGFENMQRKRNAWKQYNLEWKQWQQRSQAASEGIQEPAAL